MAAAAAKRNEWPDSIPVALSDIHDIAIKKKGTLNPVDS